MSHPSFSVEQHSVQSQLQGLTQDREKLRNEIEAADRERGNIEKQLYDLQQEYRALTQEGRQAQEKLGNFHGQHRLWQEERRRLTRQLEEDRQKLLECAQEAQDCEADETSNKEDYCLETKELIEKHENLLRKLESSRLKSLLTPGTVDSLHQLWAEKEQRMHEKKQREEAGEAASMEGSENKENQGPSFEDSLALWHQATENWNQEEVTNKKRRSQIMVYRKRVLCTNSSTNELLLEKEQVWIKADWDATAGVDPVSFDDHKSHDGQKHQNAHLDTFYGDTGSERNTVITEDGSSSYPQQPQDSTMAEDEGDLNAGEFNSATGSGSSDV